MLRLVHAARARARRTATAAYVRIGPEGGQTSVEYALVLLGAAAVALLVGAWAGGTDKVGHLLDSVLDKVLQRADS